MARKKADTIKLPDTWKHDFQQHTMRANFFLALTQPMIEFLCATADGVMWDRRRFGNIHLPDNWFATEHALTKRGLVTRKSREELDRKSQRMDSLDEWIWEACCILTPAGESVVNLLKVTGIFQEAEYATEKRLRGKKA